MEISVDAHEFGDMAKRYAGAEPVFAMELEQAFGRILTVGQHKAREVVPVDFGRLKGSIAFEVVHQGDTIIGRLGTNVEYAKPVEFGTGLFSTAPDSSHQRHWPPPDALNVWAARHGFAVEDGPAATVGLGQIVVEIIGKRGGIRPKPYLKPAFEEMTTQAPRIIDASVKLALAKATGGT